MSDAQHQERVFLCALLHKPVRILQAGRLPFDAFQCREVRLCVAAARRHNADSMLEGKTRYATREIIERVVAESLAVPARTAQAAGDHAKLKEIRAAFAGVRATLDEVWAWPGVTDDEFNALLDSLGEQVRERRMRDGLSRIIDDLRFNRTKGIHERLAALAREVDPAVATIPAATLSQDVRGVLADYAAAKNNGSNRIETPFPRLNKVTGGGKAGRLWMVTAYTGEGKTQIAKELIYHAVVKLGLGAMVFTKEQTKSDVRLMLTVRHSHNFIEGGLEFNKVERGLLNAKEEKALEATVHDLEQNRAYGPIHYVQAPGGTNMREVRSLMESQRLKQPVHAVMLDHTMLFDPSTPRGSENANLAQTVIDSKEIALDFDAGRGVWFIACHQIKREGKENADKRGFYISSDMAGTAEAERSADVVLWALRNDQLRDLAEVRLGISKDRWGPGEPRGWEVVESFASSAVFPLEEPQP